MPVSDIIPKGKLKQMMWANEAHKTEYDTLSTEHTTISKYYPYGWYQRARGMSQQELQERYKKIAYILDTLEADIQDYERRLYLHIVATEEVKASSNPFAGINFKETTLVQTSLFTE